MRLLKSQLETANKQLSSLHSDLSETRATAWKRKEEIDTLNAAVTNEKAQVVCRGWMLVIQFSIPKLSNLTSSKYNSLWVLG